MHITAIMNYKGGVGKTTTAVNLSYELARLGFKVLLVDMAPQQDATYALRGKPKKQRNLNECLRQQRYIWRSATTIYSTAKGNLGTNAPTRAQLDLLCFRVPDQIETVPESLLGVVRFMRSHPTVFDWDYMIIDTDPGINDLAINAMIAADDLIVPVQAARFSMNALSKLENYIQEAKNYNPDLHMLSALVTMFSGTKAQLQLVMDLMQRSPVPVFDTCISFDRKVDSSHDKRKPLAKHCSKRKVAEDYRALAEEYAEKTTPTKEGENWWEA